IPEALLEKLQRTRTFRAANMQMRQLGLASVDLGLHIDYQPERDGDPVSYAPGYYSYKWAEVLEADAFSRFAAAGVLSRQVGAEFRDRILSRGNEADAMELYKSFMDREPRPEALLKRAGLLGAGEAA